VRGEAWFWVIGGLLFVSLWLHEGQLFVIACILLLVAIVSYGWHRYALSGVAYRRKLSQQRAFFGETVPISLELSNDKLLPLPWVEIEDTIPGGGLSLAPVHTSPSHIPGRRLLTMLLSVRWYERVRRRYSLTCNARGVHAFGPATLRTGDVFGLQTQELAVDQEDYLLVYPKVVPLEQLRLPSKYPFGDVPVQRQWLFEDPLRTVGVREFHPGDSPRRFHWKATARAAGQAPQVKVFEQTTTHRLHVLLNVNTSDQNWSWAGYEPELLEAAVTTAASVASWATEHGLPVGLAANANLFHSSAPVRIAPSRDPRQLMHVLEALARLVPMGSMSVDSLLELETQQLAFGTTVVMVTSVAGDGLLAQLRQLKRRGHQPVLLLVTNDERPAAPLDGLLAYAVRVEDTR
jgi:uncharacterized protein (DUF58 family)